MRYLGQFDNEEDAWEACQAATKKAAETAMGAAGSVRAGVGGGGSSIVADAVARAAVELELTENNDSVSVAALVSETLRCLVAQVEYAAERGAPPARYAHASGGGVRMCRFGAECRRKDAAWHWVEADHPDDHPLISLSMIF